MIGKTREPTKSVLGVNDESVPQPELDHNNPLQKYICKEEVTQLAINKYRASGNGIKFNDIMDAFNTNKNKARRSLKYFRGRGILFTATDLIAQNISILKNKNPQQYYPTRIKAEILENKKKKSVHVQPTGVNHSKCSEYPLSNALQYQKASSYLEVLVMLPFAPPYLHRLRLIFYLDKGFYNELKKQEKPVNKAKPYEEIIGRRHVNYILSPNGTVEVYIKTADSSLRIERDEDVSAIFAFLGQVRDRFLYHVSDPKERHVPPLMSWVLKQCDLNKDIEIRDKAQLTLPDIQLVHADRVFRLYVKILNEKAYYRAEESLTLNQALPMALDTIRHPYKTIEGKIDALTRLIKATYQCNICNRHRYD